MKDYKTDYEDLVDVYNRLKVETINLEERLENCTCVGDGTMSLRDQFAMAALQGILASRFNPERINTLAVSSYEIADAMLDNRCRSSRAKGSLDF